MLELWVDEQLKLIMSDAFLTLCAEVEVVPTGCRDYNICLEDETYHPVAGLAMEMPDCGHAFHHKCITKWFGQRSTCPMCRQDLSKYLDPTV